METLCDCDGSRCCCCCCCRSSCRCVVDFERKRGDEGARIPTTAMHALRRRVERAKVAGGRGRGGLLGEVKVGSGARMQHEDSRCGIFSAGGGTEADGLGSRWQCKAN